MSLLAATIGGVPQISRFYGISIWMYWNEGSHQTAHVHARYGGRWASVAIDPPHVLAGDLPPRARSLVLEWAQLHRDELLANWEHAARDEPMVRIAPLP